MKYSVSNAITIDEMLWDNGTIPVVHQTTKALLYGREHVSKSTYSAVYMHTHMFRYI